MDDPRVYLCEIIKPIEHSRRVGGYSDGDESSPSLKALAHYNWNCTNPQSEGSAKSFLENIVVKSFARI